MKFKGIMCLALAAVLPASAANAALISGARVTSTERCEIEISGEVGGKENNRFITFFATENGAANQKVLYLGSEELDFNGNYTHKINLNADFGTFDIVAAIGTEKETKTLSYASSTWLDENVYQKIANGTLKGSALLNILLTYDVSMGLDLSDIKSERDKNILIKRVELSGANFKANQATVVSNIKAEIKFLNDLYSANHWTVAEKLVKDTLAISNIDLTKYNSASNKSDVMGGLTGVDFENFEQVGDAINNASVVLPGGGGAGGGAGGGGGGGASSPGASFSWSDKTGSGVLVQNPPKQYGFVDLENVSWAKEAINALYAKGIVSGTDETNFAPEENVTREQFAKLAVLTFGFETEGQNADFSDVEKTRWSYPYIACGYNKGIIKGTANNLFSPEEYITREDMAVILKRCGDICGIEFGEEKTDFSDWDMISDYAKEAVGALAGGGYINGTGSGAFEPKAKATRAEAAKILYEMMKGAEK